MGRRTLPVMGRLRDWLRAPTGVGVIFLVLLSMVWLGMRVPGFGWLTPFGGGSGLDLSAPPVGEIAPLRESFVSTVLGAAPPASSTMGGASTFGRAPVGVEDDGVAPEVVIHGLTNDEAADAYEVQRVPFSAHSSTSAARRGADPTDCAPVGKTVYYRYTPRENVGIVATTASGELIALAVYGREATPTSNAIACDSDPQGRAKVSFPAVADETYFFQITMQVGGPLVFSLNRRATTSAITARRDGTYGVNWGWGVPEVSKNGRFVVFTSNNPVLFEGCPCNPQAFVRDLVTGEVELASVTSTGDVPNAGSTPGGISADGRYVVWASEADNVVPGDEVDPFFKRWDSDVFIRDRHLRRTEAVTVAKEGSDLNGLWPSMSADGRYIAFAGDWDHRLNPYWEEDPSSRWIIKDVYVKDRRTGLVTRVSDAAGGSRSDHDSQGAVISPDGRYLSFWSRASNLLPVAAAGTQYAMNQADVMRGFVHVYDLKTGRREVECVNAAGAPAFGGCFGQDMSWGGRYSIFWASADLVPGQLPEEATQALSYLYRRDRVTGELDIVTTTEGGAPVGEPHPLAVKGIPIMGRAMVPSMSWDGSVVAFDSASSLIAGDENGRADIYLKDYDNRERLVRLSEGLDGEEPNGDSQFANVSGDGSMIAFLSLANNLTNNDWNLQPDAFVRFWRIS